MPLPHVCIEFDLKQYAEVYIKQAVIHFSAQYGHQNSRHYDFTQND
jgi:hypothetical protein